MIHNTFGLSSPAQTINFGEFSFANYTPITTEFSSLGVEFSPNLWTYDYNAVVAPNIDNNVLFNFNGARQ